jgi:hypothetical protein
MPQTWDFQNDKTRQWQCFVCGQAYTTFESFKDHIIQNHEEGREFVVCPLARCGAPVRDLRAHFKAKHPTEKQPKAAQMRAIIWKDQSAKKDGKDLKVRKPRFRDGYLTSEKNGGKEMHYRSAFECEVYECLEAWDMVRAYDVEPFKVPYFFDGGTHEYNPDLSIQFTDGTIEVWEIKPAKQTALPRNDAKWNACNAYCKTRGWEFKVITEVGVGKLKKAVQFQEATKVQE